MTKPSSSKANMFETLTKDDLLRKVLEQEDELERLRPKPAKFKLGQLLRAPLTHLRNNFPGQSASYFVALSLECRNGTWYYGYARKGTAIGGGSFLYLPEKVLEGVSLAEVEGGALPTGPEPMHVSQGPVVAAIPYDDQF